MKYFGPTRSKIEPICLVKRYSQREKETYVWHPQVVKLYNKNMRTLDRADQNIAQY